MFEYVPKKFPEVTLICEYVEKEFDYYFGTVHPEEVEIVHIIINNGTISEELDCMLLDEFGDIWCEEILDSIDSK